MSLPASAASLRMSSRLSGTKPDMEKDGEKDGDSLPTPTPRASAAAAARRAALAERAANLAADGSSSRPSPLDRSSAIGDRTSGLDRSSSMSDRTSGTGLSDYTSKRLEELRLRRAESAADSYSDYRSRREVKDKSDTGSISSTGSSEYMEMKLRRERERERERENSLKERAKEKENADSKPSLPTTTPPLSTSSMTSSLTSSTKREKPPIKEKPVDYRPRSENKDDEFVGFATLPDQVHRKAVKRGFDFTLMVVGETGLGKSTLITSLFLNDLYKDRKVPPVEERVQRTVGILKNNLEIEEKGVKLRLTIVDTPGFNDSVNAEDSWKPIEDYIDNQFDQYFKDESGLNRKNIKDNRVHCCLYFIPPFGHGLRQIDITFMKRLHEKVNIVPVIAKADTLTQTEIRKLKDRVLEQIEQQRIKIYEFPECDSDEDDEFKQMDKELKESIPFAVIGSNTTVEVNGRKVRGRLYPWGIVEVDNPAHCDFSKLRTMLISTHMQDLKELTRDYHYENYRARYIKEQMNKNQNARNTDGITNVIVNTVRQGKLKRDSTNFDNIIETDKLLEQKDEEIRRMQEMLLKMQQQLHSNRNQQMNGLGNL